MSLKSDLNTVAKKKLQERRRAALYRAEERRNGLRKTLPGFADLEKKIAAIFSRRAELFYSPEKIQDAWDKAKQLEKEKWELIRRAGFPPDYILPDFSCRICSDTGIFENKVCSCLKREVRILICEEINKQSGVKLTNFESFSLDYYKNITGNPEKDSKILRQMQANLEICKNFAYNFRLPFHGGLFIEGYAGLGKTHISMAVANEVIKKDYVVCYRGASDIYSAARESYYGGYRNSGKEDEFENYKNSDLLIIDDLGENCINYDFSKTAFFDLINYRLNKDLPTVINTNLDRMEIAEHFGQRLVSRLYEYTRVEFVGMDIRREKAKMRKISNNGQQT